MDVTNRQASLAHWASIVIAPLVYLTNLSIAYALVPVACDTQRGLPLHLANGITLVLMLAALALAWHVRSASPQLQTAPDDVPDRNRFLSTIGLCVSSLLVLAVVAQWSAQWILSPCFE
jgi:uncharacterized protein involved in cysteine biosynthesis